MQHPNSNLTEVCKCLTETVDVCLFFVSCACGCMMCMWYGESTTAWIDAILKWKQMGLHLNKTLQHDDNRNTQNYKESIHMQTFTRKIHNSWCIKIIWRHDCTTMSVYYFQFQQNENYINISVWHHHCDTSPLNATI